MILDPYIVKAASAVDAARMLKSLRRLYPDITTDDVADIEWIEAWLTKFKKKPA